MAPQNTNHSTNVTIRNLSYAIKKSAFYNQLSEQEKHRFDKMLVRISGYFLRTHVCNISQKKYKDFLHGSVKHSRAQKNTIWAFDELMKWAYQKGYTLHPDFSAKYKEPSNNVIATRQDLFVRADRYFEDKDKNKLEQGPTRQEEVKSLNDIYKVLEDMLNAILDYSAANKKKQL